MKAINYCRNSFRRICGLMILVCIVKTKFKKYKLILILFCIISLACGCESKKDNIEYIITSDSIQYWDIICFEHNKRREDIDGGFAFTEKRTVVSFDYIDNKYRVLSEDCDNPDQKGCWRWSVSKDSVFKTYVYGGIDMICLKITKCNKDTIMGKMLNADGEIIFVRVQDMSTVVRQGDPRRKDLLKGRFVPIAL